MAKADNTATERVEADAATDTAPVTGADAPVVEFAGTRIPADAYFVTPIERHLEIGEPGEVFMFKACEPRQLPARVILAALGVGVQVAT